MTDSSHSNNRAKPVHEIKLSHIRASIWRNGGKGKDCWYRVSIASRYRDDQQQWKDSTSFLRDDLPLVIKAAEMAYAWIWSTMIRDAERDGIEGQINA